MWETPELSFHNGSPYFYVFTEKLVMFIKMIKMIIQKMIQVDVEQKITRTRQ